MGRVRKLRRMQISLITLFRGAVLLWLVLGATASLAQPGPPPPSWPPPGVHGVPPKQALADAPLSAETWVAHGTLTLLPVGGLYAASRVGDDRLWAVGAEMGAGMVAAWLPSRLLFLRPQEAGPRWMEMEVAVFGAGLVLTPALAGLGTWALGEAALHGSLDRGDALLGALGGAAVGTLLGVVTHGALEWLAGRGRRLNAWRQLIALGLVGAGATVGYQWAGGGPRPQ
jgi:hypothetical protein